MAEAEPRRMTPEAFFEWQKRQDRNYELVDGVPVLPLKSMVGATERHDSVTVNAILLLGSQLRGKPCRPRTQDKAIRLPDGRIRRPDLLVECGSPPPDSMEADEPRVVVEVLSPSTTRYDRFQKLEEYKTHPAIRVILLIDTEFRNLRSGAARAKPGAGPSCRAWRRWWSCRRSRRGCRSPTSMTA